MKIVNASGESTRRIDTQEHTLILFEKGCGFGYPASGVEMHTSAPIAAVFPRLPESAEDLLGVNYIPSRRELSFRLNGNDTICTLEQKKGAWWRHTGRVPASLNLGGLG